MINRNDAAMNESTNSNSGRLVTIVTVANACPNAALSRFLPAIQQPIQQAERQQLLEGCATKIRTAGLSGNIDWTEADRIDGLISQAKFKSELVPLLDQYKAVIVATNGGQQ